MGGKKEGEGPLAAAFDELCADNRLGQASWEAAEKYLQLRAARLCLQKAKLPEEQVQQMQKNAPNCKISTSSEDPHGDYWRYTWYDENNATYHWVPRYEKLREQLGYNYQEYSFYWLDEKCEKSAPPEYVGIYYGKADE